jgi:hypothetical protein
MTEPPFAIAFYEIIDEVRRELNPDEGGYDTDEVVALIYHRVLQRWPCGYLTPEYEELVRTGIRAHLEDVEDIEARG